MRITEQQYMAFALSARATLKASVRLERQSANNYNCVISIHNPSENDFAFLYVPTEIFSGEWLCLYDAGEWLTQINEIDGKEYTVNSGTISPTRPQFKEWELIWIPAFGTHKFEVPFRQIGSRFHVGKQIFLLGKEQKVGLRFGYYGFGSEMISVPVTLDSDKTENQAGK